MIRAVDVDDRGGADTSTPRRRSIEVASRWLPRSFTKNSDPVGFEVVTGVHSLL